MNDASDRTRLLFDLAARGGAGPRLWAARHAQAMLFALGTLVRAPLGTGLTCAVLGIALALPAALYVVLDNVRRVGGDWEGTASISVFLAPEVDDQAARALGGALAARPDVETVRVIGRDEALEEYKRFSGFADVLDAFGAENPLPAVIVVAPRASTAAPEALGRLAAELERRPDVDLALLDLEWVRRLGAIVDLLRRAVLAGAALLAIGVVLIVGNTVRLGIDNRRHEITISRLFGATDAFIRRPFLYAGLWYGAAGGVVAWMLVGGLGVALDEPVRRVATLYDSDFELLALGLEGAAALVAGGASLGLAGSWLAVSRHLAAVEPA